MMPKLLKFSLITIASFVLLVAILIGSIFLFVDPNEYKTEITSAVQEATGRQLTITGDIKLSIYPWLGLSLGHTQLSNAKGFGDAPFASVENVDIKVKLMPLFQQRLEMQKILLRGLRANLAKNKQGVSNWDDLTTAPATIPNQHSAAQTDKAATAPEVTKPTQAIGTLGTLAVEGLELENAHLEWKDEQTNQHILLERLTLRTGQLAIPAPIDLTLSLDINMSNPEIGGHVDFSGQIAFDLETQKYRINKLDLAVEAMGAGLPVSPVNARLLASIDADLKQQKVNLNSLQLNTLGTSITGQINITELDKSPAARGEISIADFSPRDLMKKLGIALPNTSDATVLNNAKLDATFSGNMDGANLNKLAIILDDTSLTGTASVKNFTNPALRFDINVDDIDADRYLPPVTETAPSATPSPGAAAATATQLPLEPLRALNINGHFKLDKLKFTGARSSDISLGINAKNGLIKLNPIKANLYNGNYNGHVVVDVRSDTPKLSFNEALNGVNVGPLLKDTMGEELVSGTANASAQLSAMGTELAAIKKTLNGKAKFSFTDGVVKGVNIAQMIREANAKFNKKPAPPKASNETDFAEMFGSVTITNGIARNKDLTMKSPLLRIHGKGSVDLPREKIKYLVNTSIVESNEGQAGKDLKELKSLTIPIKVTGTFDKPKYSLDLGPVLQAKAKKAVEKKKKQIKKEVDKKIKSEKKKLKKKLEDDLKKKLGIKF